ncbi:MAG: formylglycine-generating enzyme family protein [Myxococcales bacterium]|nr:formylglycine-generating enzyme family protein [Myxococcales bacterium]
MRLALLSPVLLTLSTLIACGPSEPPRDASNGPSTSALPAQEAKVPAGMVLVPSATFRMGFDGGSKSEAPAHEVNVGPFLIDKLEVTSAEYRECLERKQCPPPGEGEFCNGLRPERDRHPINCIDKDGAEAFCKFRGKRLPTEAEWELAARGTDGRLYPWGDTLPNQDIVCWKRLEEKLGTCEVGLHPGGASPYGVLDMSGNVFEWTSSPFCRYGEACDGAELTGRGGSWDYSNPANMRATSRAGGPPNHKRDLLGVRCAKDVPGAAPAAPSAASARP